ncbi:Pheromone-regulated membrane protein 10 [Leucoagaricus sp. SymC.cos]|nr:Pheromone-regulated membrane protein 10 [Leucoagaricus sp. SymC.cos]
MDDPSTESQHIKRQTGSPPAAQGQPPRNTTSDWPCEEEIDAKREVHWMNAFARLNGIEPRKGEGSSTSTDVKKPKRFSPFAFLRRAPSGVSKNLEDLAVRRNFLLKLAKALLYFGAPPHRIESQLIAADTILNTRAEIVYLPNIVIVTMHGEEPEEVARTYFVRSKGRLALTSLHRVHIIYRDVLHDRMGAQEGIDSLRRILRAPPIYPLKFRCFLAFICSSTICVLAFGGSAVDMFISGICASILQYLGLSAANKSSMYANVYEISVSIFVAFVARGLSSVPGHVFCYSAISSAGVVLILPGFTVLISSLELMSKNIFCGSVRIVYAIIYTLFLGFGLTIGSDFYLVLDRRARRQYYHNSSSTNFTYIHGQFVFSNSTSPLNMMSGVIGTVLHSHASNETTSLKVIKGCLRDDSWSWWRQPFPWYAVFILVPLYSTCSSLSNLQSWRSIQLLVMVTFSCAAYAANKATSILLPGRTDIVSAAGAFVIGLLGNIYSRVVRGTAFTSMVTGVLFLVPSGIAQGGGLNQNYRNSSEQYSVGFSLALRMISLASGVTVGLFVSQVLVYLFGSRKNGAHFAF